MTIVSLSTKIIDNQQPALFNNFLNYKLRRRFNIPITFTNGHIENPIGFETWKLIDLDGIIKNYYWISNYGRLKNRDGYILKPYLINSGYYVYKLLRENAKDYKNQYKTFLVPRLVKIF